MPSSIPYDPSLALANVVPLAKLAILEEIAGIQAPVNAAEENLNSAILTLRSLDLTFVEMSNLGISTTEELNKARQEAEQKVLQAATTVVKERLEAYPKIAELKAKLATINESLESPVDYNKTEIKKMPLSADSLKMDAQYFSFDEEQEDATTTLNKLNSFVSGATSFLGTERSSQVAIAATLQTSQQHQLHNTQGTLVITVSCTHKDAVLLAPFVIDVDKAIRVWNDMFRDDPIPRDKVSDMQKIAQQSPDQKPKQMYILSGATYGSSFVGMVHILRTESTSAIQTMISTAASLQAQMEAGSWFASMKGGFGVEDTFATDAKNLLSSQQISSHVSIITVGSIPSIKSNEIAIGVKEFADFDPSKMMAKLATLANATTTDQDSVKAAAERARTGGQMLQIRRSEIESVMSGLGQVDDGKNKILDINSLMTAFEDYVQKALSGNIGAPITYYLKPIDKLQLAQMWVAKYLPGKYLTPSGDDNPPTPPPPPPPPSRVTLSTPAPLPSPASPIPNSSSLPALV